MARSIEQVIRDATAALDEGDVERFLSFHTDDAVVHIPGRSPLAGDHSGMEALRQLAQTQAQAPTRTEIHDVLVGNEHAVMLGVVRGDLGGQEIEDREVLVFHVRDGLVSEVWVYSWDQYRFDEAVAAIGTQ
jgi:ketosteroid isomerase-like protein